MGKPVCPIVIEMYAYGLKTIMEQMPYVKTRCTINTKKLKAKISANKLFCDNLAIRIGSKLLEQMGGSSAAHVGASLVAMNKDAVEPVQNEPTIYYQPETRHSGARK